MLERRNQNTKRFRRKLRERDVWKVIDLRSFWTEFNNLLLVIEEYHLYRRRLSEYEFVNVPHEAEWKIAEILSELRGLPTRRIWEILSYPMIDTMRTKHLNSGWEGWHRSMKPLSKSTRWTSYRQRESRTKRYMSKRIIKEYLLDIE